MQVMTDNNPQAPPRRREGGAWLALLAVLAAAVATLLWGGNNNPGHKPPTLDASCKDVPYAGMAPDIPGIAFGPSVLGRIANFDTLSNDERVDAVVKDHVSTWCGYSAIALANTQDFGIRPETTGDQQWREQLAPLHSDAGQRSKLVGDLVELINTATYVTVEKETGAYISEWFNRTSDGPLLIRGQGNDPDPGWVVIYHFKDGSSVTFRLGCDYQVVRREGTPPSTTAPGTTVPGGTTTTTAVPKGAAPVIPVSPTTLPGSGAATTLLIPGTTSPDPMGTTIAPTVPDRSSTGGDSGPVTNSTSPPTSSTAYQAPPTTVDGVPTPR